MRTKKRRDRDEFYFFIFTLPWIIGFIVFLVYPIVSSLYFSLTNYDAVSAPQFIGLKNYTDMMSDELLGRAVKATIYYTFLSVPINLFLSLLFAELLNQKIRFIGFFRTAIYLPSMVSGVAMSLLWIWLFNPRIGLLNYLLSLVGITGPMWLQSEVWAMPSLMIMSLWTVGSGMVVFLAGLKGVPQTYYEAAELDGASPWKRFWHITLPVISPIFLFQLIMNIINSFQVFTPAYVMTQGGPHYATWFYVYYLYTSAFTNFKVGYSSALGWLLLVFVSVFSFLIFKFSNRYVYTEGGNA